MSDLLDLAVRCEASAGPDRELDGAIHFAVVLCEPCPENVAHLVECVEMFEDEDRSVARYTASLDAAMQLVPEGYVMAVTNCGTDSPRGPDWTKASAVVGEAEDHGIESTTAATPALALCAASLKARAQSPSPKVSLNTSSDADKE
jgi:hypothetical protein